ncbi:hypothetical protein V1514DRAFT_337644 [Lipomyces japonicus]|uniref:uncharacterized protein n=1 Tax=Lipomyces japonicus TaxID=56871 RepID=UPI0034CFD346
MAAEQRKLLEQLMGADALAGKVSKRQELSLNDARVCKSYLVGTCPHDLFTNTKQDLGLCPKIHSEGMKAEYQREKEKGRDFTNFEIDYLRDVEKYILDCSRRIDAAQRRLERTPDEIAQTSSLLKDIDELNEGINASVAEIEILGEYGIIDRALKEFHAIKVKIHNRQQKEKELRIINDNMGLSGHQKLQVCDVCGAYLSRLDNDRRLADHFAGKMHLGYVQMRATYKELSERLSHASQYGRPDRRGQDRDRDHDRWARGRSGRRR